MPIKKSPQNQHLSKYLLIGQSKAVLKTIQVTPVRHQSLENCASSGAMPGDLPCIKFDTSVLNNIHPKTQAGRKRDERQKSQ
jgi:hypothetical protein